MSFDQLVTSFAEKRDDLVKNHYNEYAVMHDGKVVDVFGGYEDAYFSPLKGSMRDHF